MMVRSGLLSLLDLSGDGLVLASNEDEPVRIEDVRLELVLNRPWRLYRLLGVLTIATSALRLEDLDDWPSIERTEDLLHSILGLHDHKGILTVIWFRERDCHKYQKYLRDAWFCFAEERICHVAEGSHVMVPSSDCSDWIGSTVIDMYSAILRLSPNSIEEPGT